MAIISKRSVEKVKSELSALDRSGAISTDVLVDLNRAVWQIIADSVLKEHSGRTMPEDELLKHLRKIALIGRRERADNERLQ